MRMEEDFVPHVLVTSLETNVSSMLSKFLLNLGASSHSLDTLILHQPDTFKTQNYLINIDQPNIFALSGPQPTDSADSICSYSFGWSSFNHLEIICQEAQAPNPVAREASSHLSEITSMTIANRDKVLLYCTITKTRQHNQLCTFKSEVWYDFGVWYWNWNVISCSLSTVGEFKPGCCNIPHLES